MESIIVALITGGLALAGVIVSNNKNHDKIQSELKQEFKVAQAVTDTKIEALTEEVKKHNGFATRLPTVETEVSEIFRRLDRIESEVFKK